MADTSIGIRSGARLLRHDEIAARSARAVNAFKSIGVDQGDCVAILMRNDIDFLVASYAAIALGAFAVPINWHFKPEEVGFVLRDCAAKASIVHTDLLRAVKGAIPEALLVLAVEAFEGTNRAIQRGGKLGGRGAVVIKVPKAGHDMRFDIPVIGKWTLKSLKKAKASCLAIEAGGAILLNKDELIAQADAMGLAVIVLEAQS